MNSRRQFIQKIVGGAAVLGSQPLLAIQDHKIYSMPEGADPTQCDYVPPGEYMKDHSFVYKDGWYHLFNISGTAGYYHGYNGNEETVAWSISKDLVNWEFRGHVLHATQIKGAFDQHEIWAPFCYKANGKFYMFYTGIIHPTRPMEYKKLGHDHPWVWQGHKETQGLAVSDDLTNWEKVSDFEKGINVPGRDSNVAYDEENKRYLLYSTIGTHEAHVSESSDLINWKPIGICAKFGKINSSQNLGATTGYFKGHNLNASESLHIMKHPITGQWIMLGNWSYITSDDPLKFEEKNAKLYNLNFNGKIADIGFAGEMIEINGKWYRSGTFGKRDYWKLGFTKIEWDKEGAFKITKPSILNI